MLASAGYSILLKKECAHDYHIYCSAWTKTKTSEDPKAPLKDFIVTGGLDCLVKIWLFLNNKLDLVHTLVGHEMAVVSVAITADGHTVASSSIDSTLMIWDLLTGHKVHVIQEPGTDVWKLAFSPDGTGIITGSHTGKLCIFGTEKASFEKILDTRGRFVLSVDWSANGKHIVSGSTDGLLCLFDAAQGKLLHVIQAHTKSVNSVAFSQDSRSIVTASAEGEVHTYNTASATKQCTAHHATRAMAACFSPDGGRVATALGDGSVIISLTDKLQPLHVFKEHTTTVCDVQFNAKGNKLLTVSKDKSIIIYECPIPPKVAVKK